jgi:ketosteroid isomerase-like protein
MHRFGWLAVLSLGACAGPDAAPSNDPLAPELTTSGVDQRARGRRSWRRIRPFHRRPSGSAGLLSHLADDVTFLPLAHPAAAAAIAALLAAPPAPFTAEMKLSWTYSRTCRSTDGGLQQRPCRRRYPGMLGSTRLRRRRRRVAGGGLEFSGAFFGPGELPPFFGHPPTTGMDRSARRRRPRSGAARTDAAFAQTSVDLGMAGSVLPVRRSARHPAGRRRADFIIGRKAIFQSRRCPAGLRAGLTPFLAGVGPLGDLGWTMGNFVATDQFGQRFGKYLTIWQKSPNGEWKFVQDAGSSTPPPAL